MNRCQEEFEKENVVGHWEEALGKNTPKEEKELPKFGLMLLASP